MTPVERLRNALIVSCQPPPGASPVDPGVMAFMALAAEAGGAGGIRAAGPADIMAIKRVVSVPVIGLLKRTVPNSEVRITATYDDAAVIAGAGADLIAVDATRRVRPDGGTPEDLIRRIVNELGLPVVADIDGLEAATAACAAGASMIATTLAGYTNGVDTSTAPDVALVRSLARWLSCPVVAEGRYREPHQVAVAFSAGAYAVVVGGAITDPAGITRRFVDAVPALRDEDR